MLILQFRGLKRIRYSIVKLSRNQIPVVQKQPTQQIPNLLYPVWTSLYWVNAWDSDLNCKFCWNTGHANLFCFDELSVGKERKFRLIEPRSFLWSPSLVRQWLTVQRSPAYWTLCARGEAKQVLYSIGSTIWLSDLSAWSDLLNLWELGSIHHRLHFKHLQYQWVTALRQTANLWFCPSSLGSVESCRKHQKAT